MIESIIDGWWKVLALLAGALAFAVGLAAVAIRFIRKAKDAGVDEMSAGPVKVDFDDDAR